MEFKKILDEFISKNNGRKIDFFYELVNLILDLDTDTQHLALQYICENFSDFQSEEGKPTTIQQHFTEDDLEKSFIRIHKKFVKRINDLTIELSKANTLPEEYYKEVWLLITSNKICKNKHDRALAIVLFMDNDFIPYYPVGIGISMENSEYVSIIDSFDNFIITSTETILRTDYEQKTQQASLLVERMDSLETLEEKTVYLTMILDMLKSNIKNTIKSKIDNM